MTEIQSPPRHQLPLIALLILAVLGAGVSMVLIVHHVELQLADAKGVEAAASACNINATFNCDAVARSAWSTVFGIPLGAFGLAYFLALCALSVHFLCASGLRREVMDGWLVVTTLGLAASIALFLVSKFGVGSFCLYCMGVYLVCLLMWVVSLLGGRGRPFLTRLQRGVSDIVNGIVAIFQVANGSPSPRGVAFAVLLLTLCSLMVPSFVAARVAARVPTKHTGDRNRSLDQLVMKWEMSDRLDLSPQLQPGLEVDYSKGTPGGRVQIVEFLDLECPACSRFHREMKDVVSDYGSEVHLILKNYPLDQACNPVILREMHRNACFFAVLARCAGEQGKFWEAVDFIFGSGDQDYETAQAHRAEALRMVEVLGLDAQGINECVESRRHNDKLVDDIREANALQVQGTPTVFVDGKRLPVASPELLRAVLDSLLRAGDRI